MFLLDLFTLSGRAVVVSFLSIVSLYLQNSLELLYQRSSQNYFLLKFLVIHLSNVRNLVLCFSFFVKMGSYGKKKNIPNSQNKVGTGIV